MINYIVVHCSDSPNYRADRRFDTAADIHRWHKEKGWAGIGYHYVIDESGMSHNGRPVFLKAGEIWQGAHVQGYNQDSIGICLIGEDYFYPEQLDTLRKTIDTISDHFPDAKVVGHRDLDSKRSCPNFNATLWYATGEIEI